MKRKCLLAGLGLAMGIFCACTQEETEARADMQQRRPLTAAQAAANASAFLQDFYGGTRAAAVPEVADVQAVTLRGVSGAATRGVDGDEVVYYVVGLKDGQGYVLASADERNMPVYAYVPEGSYDDAETAANEGLQFYLASLAERIVNPDETALLKVNQTQASTVAPLLQTAWGPGMPYNLYATTVHHATSAGLALGQICAYYACPDTLTCVVDNVATDFPLDWAAIQSECAANNGTLLNNSQHGSSVAMLCLYLGGENDNITPQRANMFLYRMANLGYDYYGLQWAMLGDDDPDIIAGLENGHPTFARGCQTVSDDWKTYSKGTAWVIDGYQNGLYHCNWGLYGSGNGYFSMEGVGGSDTIPYQYNTSFCDLGLE